MPKFQIYLLDEPHTSSGHFEEWELPWERLVFDQRLDYPAEGPDKKVYKVVRVVDRYEGPYVEVVADPGVQRGADPKKGQR